MLIESVVTSLDREAMTCRLQEVCSQAAHALAAPMPQAIALTAPAALGLFCASSHEPFHADGGRKSIAVTKRSCRRAAAAPRLAMVRQDSRSGRCTAESGRTWIKRRRCAQPGPALLAPGAGLGRPRPARPAPCQPPQRVDRPGSAVANGSRAPEPQAPQALGSQMDAYSITPLVFVFVIGANDHAGRILRHSPIGFWRATKQDSQVHPSAAV